MAPRHSDAFAEFPGNLRSPGLRPQLSRGSHTMTTASAPLPEAPPRTGTPILEARGLSRSFGHVRALNNAAFDIYPGEVVALIGDNGAGKSTMVKALTGNLELDSGELFFEGRPVTITSPEQATQMGMEVVYQDLALAPHLNPVQNMFLGREIPRKGILGPLGFMDEKAMRAKAKAGFDELGGTVRSYTAPVGSMSGGQRQQIAIVRAISWASKLVFLDEPTAALGVVQTKERSRHHQACARQGHCGGVDLPFDARSARGS
jgi:ABC-type sugar transport system, ATPase component